MGNQVSSQSNEGGNKKPKLLVQIQKNESKDSWFMKDNSSYKGILSKKSVSSEGQSTAVKKDSKDTCEEEQTTVDTVNQETKDVKLQTHFEWKDEGNIVYLTGSFCNWTQKFLMNKVNNKFELNLDLIRGVYQYKFIIDGVWKFSKHHATCNDGRGNINNIIDTTNFPIPVKEKEKIEKIQKSNEEKFRDINFKKENNNEIEIYNSQIPAKNDLYVEALLCPNNYLDYYNINHISNQHSIGKEEYIIKEDEFIFYDSSSYREISIPPHVNLNHLCTAKVNNKKGVLYTSSSQRIRNKYLTIIYYKPVN